MAPLNATSNDTPSGLAQGWVDSPDGRGTIDIVWSCIITIFLCSWSVLCLNVPAPQKGRWSILANKCRWVLFTILCPEVVTALAAEQWSSAKHSVKEFASTCKNQEGFPVWTMRQAFFADMGGFVLHSPDFPAFPVDAQQVQYLVVNKYIPYPNVDEKEIWDKNKADGFVRALTIIQTLWFGLQCIGRATQRLPVTTFELSTLAFVFCTIPTFFFWHHKPLGVEAPIALITETSIKSILGEPGACVKAPYRLSPLEFVNPPPGASLLTPFWLSLKRVFHLGTSHNTVLITEFGNSARTSPQGLSYAEMAVGAAIGLGYTGLHLVGWNFGFPTTIEHTFWRVASSILVGLVVLYLLFLALGSLVAEKIARKYFHAEAKTILELVTLLPSTLQMLLFIPALGAYGASRLYTVVEAFVGLRALPAGAYTSVNWSNFLPHI
ncbi:MAG: hypothetical protein M1812_007818 [Candelaria pacifica]|nr:MAG: hypothetical protein M1812_007818 [Candelaria pacifica]